MDRKLFWRITTSAILALATTLLIAALQFYGVINMGLGRLLLIAVYVVLLGVIMFSKWVWRKTPWLAALVFIVAALIVGGLLLKLDKWAVAHGIHSEPIPSPSLQLRDGHLEVGRVTIVQFEEGKPLTVEIPLLNTGQKPIYKLLFHVGIELAKVTGDGHITDIRVHEHFVEEAEKGFRVHSETRTFEQAESPLTNFYATRQPLSHEQRIGLIDGTYRLYTLAFARYMGEIEDYDLCRWSNAPGPVNPQGNITYDCALRSH